MQLSTHQPRIQPLPCSHTGAPASCIGSCTTEVLPAPSCCHASMPGARFPTCLRALRYPRPQHLPSLPNSTKLSLVFSKSGLLQREVITPFPELILDFQSKTFSIIRITMMICMHVVLSQ